MPELWWLRVGITHPLLNHNYTWKHPKNKGFGVPGGAGTAHRAAGGADWQITPLSMWKLHGSPTGSLDQARTELRALLWLPAAMFMFQAAALGHLWSHLVNCHWLSGQEEPALGVHENTILSKCIEHGLPGTWHCSMLSSACIGFLLLT